MERNENFKKRIVAGALVGSIALTGGTIIKSSIDKKKNKNFENQIGFTNVSPLLNSFDKNVSNDNFVILDAGDYDDLGVRDFKSKVKYCNKHDISLGLIITTDSKSEADIYNDVEYVKELISKYKISFPVYLDVTKIINNDLLNNEMKTKLIKDFCEKLSSNGVYVGLYGKDSDLVKIKKYCEIIEYDAFLVKESEDIKYDGVYNIVEELDGTLTSKFVSTKNGEIFSKNISTIIEQKKLNSKDKFKNDGCYIMSKDDDINDIAMRYGMSVKELLEFNDIKKVDLKEGLCLRIPSVIGTTIKNDGEKKPASKIDNSNDYLLGCDMSYCQTKNDWDKIEENFDFIILRANNGTAKDNLFEKHYENCCLHGIPVGAYCYNSVTSNVYHEKEEFIKQVELEAKKTLELLKNKNIDYPVYLDIENATSNLNPEYIEDMLLTWKKVIEKEGYIAGIYCNQSMFNYLKLHVSFEISDKLELWLAGGPQYSSNEKHSNLPFEKIIGPDKVDAIGNGINSSMVQITNIATNAGAANGAGHVDINYSKVNYAKKTNIKDKDEKKWKIKKSKVKDLKPTPLSAVVSLSGLTFVGYLIKKKKNYYDEYLGKEKKIRK